jgi:hypothetical protein
VDLEPPPDNAKNRTPTTPAKAPSLLGPSPQFENCIEPCQTKCVREPSISTLLQRVEITARRPPSIPATQNHSVATDQDLPFTLRDLATPILRHKRTMLFTFLLVLSATLMLGHTTTLPLLPAHSSAATILIAILLGLLLGLSLTYLVDYRDPCFHSPVQVIRTLRIPLAVAIPRRAP